MWRNKSGLFSETDRSPATQLFSDAFTLLAYALAIAPLLFRSSQNPFLLHNTKRHSSRVSAGARASHLRSALSGAIHAGAARFYHYGTRRRDIPIAVGYAATD